MSGASETRFRCVRCGKLTAGTMPRDGAAVGDTSERWPRLHRLLDGGVCPGVYEYAEWVEVEVSGAKAKALLDRRFRDAKRLYIQRGR